MAIFWSHLQLKMPFVKKLNAVHESDFERLYTAKDPASVTQWEPIAGPTIAHIDQFVCTDYLWYLGDFKAGSIVAAGGDTETCSPLGKNDWVGLHPMELGKLFHPLDMRKMQAFIVFIASYLSKRTAAERSKIRVSMTFRMLNNKQQYTWRMMQYPLMHYEKQDLRYILCLISDYSHLNPEPKCCMCIHDRNMSEHALYSCDEETIVLKKVHPAKPLTSREIQVLKLLAKGLISKEIAEVLQISKNTVENHKQNMFAKTGMKKLTELVSYANKHFNAEDSLL
jgi:DNA-binding CsgD family transcriptional regulator